jgi:2-C-methyl-D-erythritol 4-phosphate cytidylyltransferase
VSHDATPTPGPVRVGVAVPAAGVGRRMGGVRKPFVELAGEPVLRHTLRALLSEGRITEVVVALGPDEAADPPGWLVSLDPRVVVVEGGATRAESVRRALAGIRRAEVIVVHDAARPFVDVDVLSRCIDVAATGEGAVAGSRAVDTMKMVGPDGLVRSTPDRSTLWHAHTPQAFPAAVLRRAYEGDLVGATDDASLVERLQVHVRMVDSGAWNLKVTRPVDLRIAEALLRASRGEQP